MAQAHHFLPVEAPALDKWPRLPAPEFLFQSLVPSETRSRAGGLSGGLGTSLLLHALLVAVVVIAPIVLYDAMPEPGVAIRGFFVSPVEIAPAPPPPPPPPAAAARMVRQAVEPRPVEAPAFVAPIDVPAELKQEATLDLGLGVEGGVPGGVEGGVPGGVVGGVVGGAFGAAPPPTATKAVRVGGAIRTPQLLKKVQPEYPALAAQARVGGIVIIEAEVDVHGVVKTATVLRGHILLDEAALAAVRQWRYRPLLLNGVPSDFILTVTVVFNIQEPVK